MFEVPLFSTHPLSVSLSSPGIRVSVVDVQDDFMSFIVMFMGSPRHVRNPYLRAKMVEVLTAWLPSRR